MRLLPMAFSTERIVITTSHLFDLMSSVKAKAGAHFARDGGDGNRDVHALLELLINSKSRTQCSGLTELFRVVL